MDDRDGVRGIVGRGATNHRAGVLLIPQNYNSAAADAESGSSCKVGDLSPPSLPPSLAPAALSLTAKVRPTTTKRSLPCPRAQQQRPRAVFVQVSAQLPKGTRGVRTDG